LLLDFVDGQVHRATEEGSAAFIMPPPRAMHMTAPGRRENAFKGETYVAIIIFMATFVNTLRIQPEDLQ
jgi:hypothetical protein